MAVVAVLSLEAGGVLAQAPAGSPPANGASPNLPALTAPGCGPVVDGGHEGLATALETSAVDGSNTFRISGEYLLWRTHGGMPAEVSNVLGAAGVGSDPVLNSMYMNSWRSGFRGFATYAPADDWWPVLEVGGFVLQNSHGSFDATVATHPGLTPAAVPAALFLQPVIDGSIDVPNSRGIVDTPIPGPNGSVDLDPSDVLTSHLRGTSQRQLWGLEANLRSRTWYFGGLRFDGLAGFRYVNLREKLTVQGDFTAAEPPAGGDPDESPDNPEDGHTNTMHTFDSIEIRNNFYGGQLGVSFETNLCEHLLLGGFFKLAMGGTGERITQVGSTVLDATTIETHAGGPFIPRPTTVLPGGLFTPQVAGGITTHNTRFSVLTDLNINLGYLITPNLQAYVGYNYMRLSNVARIGGQSLIVGYQQGHLELQGLDLGLQLRY
jgi:hypothetical protein